MRLNKILISALTISTTLFAAPLFASTQTEADREALRKMLNEDKQVDIDNRRSATRFDFGQMDLALRQKKYDTFFGIVSELKSDNSIIEFLESKTHYGHIPVYWVLADIHSRRKSGFDAHKWLYIATITTEQDIALCGDKAVEGNTKRILKSFPDAMYYTRSTPYYIKDAMQKTYEFISNISERQPPDWVCQLRDPGFKKKPRPVNKAKWDSERSKVLEKYAGAYKPQITSKDIFKELEAKENLDKRMEELDMKRKQDEKNNLNKTQTK